MRSTPRTLNRGVAVSTFCLAAAVHSTLAQAQSTLEEVVVTAQKREQSVNDVGITVATFTADQLQAYGVRSAADLESLTPGLTITEAAPTGVPVYTIRGVGFSDFSTASSSTVGLYLDEAAIPYAVMSRGALFDVQRVEVLKGPQGDLYGRNTTAGQINFISNKPTREFEGGARVDFSRFSTIDVEAFASGPLSERIQARLAAKVVNSDKGWQQSISRPGDTLGRRDDIALRGLVNFDIGESGALLLNFRWMQDKSENMAPTAYDGTVAGLPGSQPLPTAFDATPYFRTGDNRAADWVATFVPERDNTHSGVTARLTLPLTESIELTSITAYDDFERDERYETSGVAFEDGNTTNTTDAEVFSQELRLASTGDGALSWIAGAYYSDDTLQEGYDFLFRDSFFGFALGINEISTRYEQETSSVAGFGHVEWKFADGYRLTLGARYTNEKREWSGCTYDRGDGSLSSTWNNILTPFTILANGLPDPGAIGAGDCAIYNDVAGSSGFGTFGVFSREIETNKWMGKVSIDYSPSDDVLLYGTISNGFKSGGFNGASAQTHSQLLPYEAETLTSYEVGLKSTLLDRRMQLNASAFYYDYKDKQEPTVAVTPVGNIAGLTNVPKSEIYGAELDLRWLVTEGFTLDAGIAYLRTEIKEYLAIDAAASTWPNVVTIDASGRALANSPEWQANATGRYEWPVGNDLKLFAAADLAYKDDSGESVQDPISDYFLVNARLGVGAANDTWAATVWGRNLGNEYYWVAAFGSNGTFVRMNGMPRTYGITLDYRF